MPRMWQHHDNYRGPASRREHACAPERCAPSRLGRDSTTVSPVGPRWHIQASSSGSDRECPVQRRRRLPTRHTAELRHGHDPGHAQCPRPHDRPQRTRRWGCVRPDQEEHLRQEPRARADPSTPLQGRLEEPRYRGDGPDHPWHGHRVRVGQHRQGEGCVRQRDRKDREGQGEAAEGSRHAVR